MPWRAQFSLPERPFNGCETACDGCRFEHTVNASQNGANCDFTWAGTRTNCTNEPDETWNGTISVPCGSTKVLEFHCDRDEDCVGYSLSLQAHSC